MEACKLMIFVAAVVACVAWADDHSGQAGSFTYYYKESTKTLTINGTGDMDDYCDMWSSPQWMNFDYSEEVWYLVIGDGITSIGNCSFSGSPMGGIRYLKSVSLPDSITRIGKSAFSGRDALVNITLPNGITSIGDSAFYGCHFLENVVLPSELTYIGESAFEACVSFTKLVIPSKVSWIGKRAFYTCWRINEITIESNVVPSIESSVFWGISSVKKIILPDSVTKIGDAAFSGCTMLKEVKIPDGVTSIGVAAFDGCIQLSKLTLPKNITTIAGATFRGDILLSVDIPSTVTTIGDEAFYGCLALHSVSIPSGVTSIGSHAFANCPLITSIEIPENCTTVSQGAFAGCTGLTSINVHAGNKAYQEINGVLYNKNGNYIVQYPSGKPGPYTIPSTVTSIDMYAFQGCTSLASVTIEPGLTVLSGFYECLSLESIVIPNTIKTMANYAFYGCVKLNNVVIPESVEEFYNFVFENCLSLESMKLPKSVTRFGSSMFLGCVSLKNVTLPDNLYNIPGNMFYGCVSLESVVMSADVTTIYSQAFLGCLSLTSMVLGPKVTSIDNYAFAKSGLWSITIPESVTSIGTLAFNECANLTSVIYSGFSDIKGCSALSQAASLDLVCVPSNYSENSFCGSSKICTSDNCIENSRKSNPCYQTTCDGTSTERASAKEWVAKTTECMSYQCSNESGLLVSADCIGNGMICMNEKLCRSKESQVKLNSTSWPVEVVLTKPVSPTESFATLYNIKVAMQSVTQNPAVYNLNYGTETDSEGNIVGFVIFCTSESQAKNIVQEIRNFEKGCDPVNYQEGILCLTKSVGIYGLHDSSSQASQTSHTSQASKTSHTSTNSNHVVAETSSAYQTVASFVMMICMMLVAML